MDIEKVKRYSLMEVVLLAVFVFGLLIAHVIVNVRGNITLSEPIELPNSGLEVSMPANPGWQYVQSWQYEADTSMTLVGSRVRPRQNQMHLNEMDVRWRYIICTPSGSVNDLLYERAQKANALLERIEVVGQQVPMHYAKLSSLTEEGRDYFIGVARLDFGRSVELQVLPHSKDLLLYAEGVIRSLGGSIQYEKPQQFETGKELLSKLWEQVGSGEIKSSVEATSENAFLIKDSNNNTTGFFYGQHANVNTGKQGLLQIHSRQHAIDQLSIDSTLWLDGSDQTFVWKTSVQLLGMGQPREYTTTLDQEGKVSLVRNFDKDRTLHSDGLLLPNVLIDDYLRLFLDSGQQAVTIDVVSPTGQIVPVQISLIEADKASAQSEDIDRVVQVNYMYHRDSFEEYFYGKDQQLIGRLERQPGQAIRLWEPTTEKKLKLLFGDTFKPTNQKTVINIVSN